MPNASLLKADGVLVHRKPVKRLTLRVRSDGQIEMIGPKRLSEHDFEQFYQQKRDWVHKIKARQTQQKSLKPKLELQQFLLHGEVVDLAEPLTSSLASIEPTALAAMQRAVIDNDAELDPDIKHVIYRYYASIYLPKRLEQLSAQHKLPFGKTSIRAQRTRWGSCSAAGNISLNWRLIQMPFPVCDYVLLHELAHTQHMNHSAAFWQLVATMDPNWHTSKEWLKQHGNALPD